MNKPDWQTLGDLKVLANKSLQEIAIGKIKVALTYLREGAEALIKRSIETVEMMIESNHAKELVRGGRKAHILNSEKS